jgi:hypothetical protein
MTKYDENELRSPNEADLILTNLKDKLNIRFDKDLSNTLGINHYDLGNWRRRGSIPKDWYVRIKRDYLNDLEIQVPEKTKKINKGKEKIEMYEYVIELQKEKIESQADKILLLEKQLVNTPKDGYQLWDNILFDVSTYQVHDDNWSQNFKIYEMNHYHDFYQRLGYTRSEAEKYWKITHRMMTNRIGMSTKDQWDFYMDGKAMPKLINVDKTDVRVTSAEQVSAHFDYAIKHNIATQMQVYNTCYFKKDGSDLHAVLSVLYNFTNMSSETKIKFIEESNTVN